MLKFSIFKRYIITLLLVNSIVTASERGFYLIGRGGPGIHKKAEINSSTFSLKKKDDTSSELAILKEQLSGMITHIDRPLGRHLWQAVKKTFNSPPYTLIEVGLGYRFQYIMPLSIELKGLSRRMDNDWYSYLSSGFKLFIPLGSHTKLYGKIGKCFTLNLKVPSSSPLPIDSTVLKDIKKTIWESTLQKQWASSGTFIGGGISRKLSSRLELDLSLDSYTIRERKIYYYIISLGINYLFE